MKAIFPGLKRTPPKSELCDRYVRIEVELLSPDITPEHEAYRNEERSYEAIKQRRIWSNFVQDNTEKADNLDTRRLSIRCVLGAKLSFNLVVTDIITRLNICFLSRKTFFFFFNFVYEKKKKQAKRNFIGEVLYELLLLYVED